MKKQWCILVCAVLSASVVLGADNGKEGGLSLRWSRLPQCPAPAGRDKQIGLAGMYAGVHQDVLIIAGGANFADGPAWEKGKKVWYDDIYFAEKVKAGEPGGKAELDLDGKEIKDGPHYKWTRSDVKLPVAFGYGASISTPRGVVCIGGHDSADGRGGRHVEMFRLKWNSEKKSVEVESLVPLPKVSRMWCADMIDNVIYLVGFTESGPGEREKHFWALDLAAEDKPGGELEWRELRTWKGPVVTATAYGVQDGKFYLFGGNKPAPDKDGKPASEQSLANYQFTPRKRGFRGGFREGKWKQVGDIPRPIVVPPTPALAAGASQLLVFSGWDGTPYDGEVSKHPGFSREVLSYDASADSWRKLGTMPYGVVTGPTARWGDMMLIVSGEMRPCIRNPDILVARPE